MSHSRRFLTCPPTVLGLTRSPEAVRTDADTLGHTSAAVSWQSQRSWEKELAQTSRQCRSQGLHSLVRLLRVGREAHTLLSPDSLSPVSREPSAP